LWGEAQKLSFPLITKWGVNENGKTLRYLFNYSAKPATVSYTFGNGTELLSNQAIRKDSSIDLTPWGFKVIEEQ
jgi:beta-galactosidase